MTTNSVARVDALVIFHLIQSIDKQQRMTLCRWLTMVLNVCRIFLPRYKVLLPWQTGRLAGRQNKPKEKDIVASTNCPFDVVSNDRIIIHAETCQGSKNLCEQNDFVSCKNWPTLWCGQEILWCGYEHLMCAFVTQQTSIRTSWSAQNGLPFDVVMSIWCAHNRIL